MTRTVIPHRRPAARGLAPALVAIGGLAAFAGTAPAAAPRCPTRGVDTTTITWGAPSADRPLSTTSVTSHIRLTGLAADGDRRPPTIRTPRDARRRRPVLCAGGRVRAALPALAPGETVQAASVNDTTVAWRQTTTRGRTTTVRAVVRAGRLVDVRRAAPSTPSRVAAGDHRIVVTAGATVAWALGGGPATRVWAWPRARRTPTAMRTRGLDGVEYLRVLDDQSVLTDGSRVALRYAPATPGRCPVLADPAPTRALGGWSVTQVAGWRLGDDGEEGGESWNVVCDPGSGRYVDIVADEHGAAPGLDSGARRTTHIVRSGEWLVSSQHGEGSFVGDRTMIARATTGRRYLADGRVEGPGIDHAGEHHALPPTSGAVVGPGYVAFVATNADSSVKAQTLMLSDARGTRTVATGRAAVPLAGLTADGTTLTWTAGGVGHAAPIVAATGAPYAVVRPELRDGF
jgi:hypothetical protein